MKIALSIILLGGCAFAQKAQKSELSDTRIERVQIDQGDSRKPPFITVGIDTRKQAVIDGVSFSDAQFFVLLTQVKKHEPNLVLRLRAPKDLLFSASRRLIRVAAKAGVPAIQFQPEDKVESREIPADH